MKEVSMENVLTKVKYTFIVLYGVLLVLVTIKEFIKPEFDINNIIIILIFGLLIIFLFNKLLDFGIVGRNFLLVCGFILLIGYSWIFLFLLAKMIIAFTDYSNSEAWKALHSQGYTLYIIIIDFITYIVGITIGAIIVRNLSHKNIKRFYIYDWETTISEINKMKNH